MALISFLGVFYIFLAIVLLVLFFYESKDMWFKSFYFIGFLAVIIFLIHFSYFQTNVDNDAPMFVEKFTLGGFNPSVPVLTGQRVVSNDDDIHGYVFSDIDSKFESLFVNSNFCFYYNDTGDGSNAVGVYNGVISLTDNFYIGNDSDGFICSHINSAHVRKDFILGVRCLDCSGSNTLAFNTGGSVNVSELIINSSDTLNYSVVNQEAHAFWVETTLEPIDGVNDNFWLFIWFLFGYSLMFIMRIVYRFAEDGTKY